MLSKNPETIVLTKGLIRACSANGAFTATTINAFEVPDLGKGWTKKLIGKTLLKDQYKRALDGRYMKGDYLILKPENRA